MAKSPRGESVNFRACARSFPSRSSIKMLNGSSHTNNIFFGGLIQQNHGCTYTFRYIYIYTYFKKQKCMYGRHSCTVTVAFNIKSWLVNMKRNCENIRCAVTVVFLEPSTVGYHHHSGPRAKAWLHPNDVPRKWWTWGTPLDMSIWTLWLWKNGLYYQQE